MPGLYGNSNSSGYYNASGEATQQAKLPQEFVPGARSTNAINASLCVPPDWNGNTRRQPIVQRAERTVGMKYLYVRGAHRMPIQPLGADGTPRPWNSSYNRNFHGTIQNAGFNDALFQAGYPGYNLGLSFKVPQGQGGVNLRAGTSPGWAMRMRGPKNVKQGTQGVINYSRGLGRGSQ